MDDFPIVDPHHHLWDLERFSYPWLSARPLPASVAGDVAPIAKSYLLDDYLADTARQNVVKSVHVDAGFDPSQPVEETRWLQSIADQRGFPHGIVARAELHRPDVETTLASHCRFPNVRGIRHIVGGMCETEYSGYPDCRDDTIKALQVALNLGMDKRFVLHTPLMWIDKAATWQLARELGGDGFVALIVEHTHSCYLGERTRRHEWGYGCGTCPACGLRAAGYRTFMELAKRA